MVSGGDPPKLRDAAGYLSWKREINVWRGGTGIDNKRQGSLAALSILEPKARDYATRLDLAKLQADTGLAYLLEELDKFFKKDQTQTVFLAIEKLLQYHRTMDVTMGEYIAEFNRKVSNVKELGGEGESIVQNFLTYFLLKQANLSAGEMQLIKCTIPKLDFETMTETLRKAFGDMVLITSQSDNQCSGMVKVEPVEAQYFEVGDNAEDTYYSGSKSRQNSSRGRGGFRGYNRKQPNRPEYENKTSSTVDRQDVQCENMRDPGTGKVRRCYICDSKYHFARECPDGEER